jgi:hypothetical protein
MEVKKILLGLIVALLLIPAGAFAETQTFSDVYFYDVSVTQGMVITQVTIDNVPIGVNQSHTFYSGPDYFTLEVNSIADEFAGVNYHSTFQLKLNNGTVTEELTMDKYSVSHDYKLYIQMIDPLEPGAMTNLLSVNLYVGMKPLTARFDLPPNFGSYTEIPMTRVSGSTGAYTNVYVTQDTYEDFISLSQGSISHIVEEATGIAISAILSLIALIPFVGPHFVNFLTFSGTFLGEGGFWIGFVIANFLGLLFAAQSIIIMIACVNGRFNPSKSIERIIAYNVGIVHFIRLVYETLYNLILQTIQAIGSLK